MDLRHDWKALNEVLFQNLPTGALSSLVLLEDQDKIIDGVASNGRAFDDFGKTGASANKEMLDALAAKYGTDQTLVLSKKVLDQCVVEASDLGTNYFQQLQALRENITGQVGRKQNALIVSRRHFLLDLFGRQLKRILPRRFNVLLFLDQRSGLSQLATPFSYRAILMSYSQGQLDQFFEPDFSSLHENRLTNWQNETVAIGEYLESRYMLPCYGVFMHNDEWERCLTAAHGSKRPWSLFVRYVDDGRAAVYPNGFIAKSLLASQRLMVYFGRL